MVMTRPVRQEGLQLRPAGDRDRHGARVLVVVASGCRLPLLACCLLFSRGFQEVDTKWIDVGV